MGFLPTRVGCVCVFVVCVCACFLLGWSYLFQRKGIGKPWMGQGKACLAFQVSCCRSHKCVPWRVQSLGLGELSVAGNLDP